MKLTTKKLYQLIMEALMDYSGAEQKYFGPGIKQIMDQGNQIYKDESSSLNPAWIAKNIGERIGSGYSREVYAIDNSDMVIKFSKGTPQEQREGIESNQMEFELFNKYPCCFPKAYLKDKTPNGPEWIIVEEVVVISSQEQMDRVLKNCFPSLTKAADYLKSIGRERVDHAWVWERLLDAWDEVIVGQDEQTPGRYEEWEFALQSSRITRGIKDEEIQTAWEIATMDQNLMLFITTLRDLDVEFDEVRYGNVGTNSDENKLILIDISKFDFEGDQS